MKSFEQLTDAEILSIRRRHAKNTLTYAEIADIIGTDKQTVIRVVKQHKNHPLSIL